MIDRARGSVRRNARGRTLGEDQIDFDFIAGQSEAEPDEDWLALYGSTVLEAALEEVRRQIEPKNPNKWAAFELHTLQGKRAPEVAAQLGISANLVYQNASRVYREVEQVCLLKYEESLQEAQLSG
jgi:DNA-directed RNA polymerase specialized sigma24 family protein